MSSTLHIKKVMPATTAEASNIGGMVIYIRLCTSREMFFYWGLYLVAASNLYLAFFCSCFCALFSYFSGEKSSGGGACHGPLAS